ncbi:hypothetical protein GCM10010492_58470 [Saccharothrix mutabilis subsp. mutabilis]|uniref:SHOCT domain-containing protein n=1 Tax=Saccharothrix mutabilis subsp. mutabilis TaxID=66855 RepID=A0ABN0UHV5_9PSEU
MHWYLEPGFDPTTLLVLMGLVVIGAALSVAALSLRRPVAATRRALDMRLALGEIDVETHARMAERLRDW